MKELVEYIARSLVDHPEQADRVVAGHLPEVAVQTPEERNGIVVLGPTQVVGQVPQALQWARQ